MPPMTIWASALMNLGRTDEARAAFEHAVQLNDKNPDADRNYSRLLNQR